jgi:hypothetical protein
MKVALVLSGQFRNGYKQAELLKENIIQPFNADVFIGYRYVDTPDCTEDELISLYNPKQISFKRTPQIVYDGIEAYGGLYRAIETDPHSPFHMWYGIHSANELKKNWEQQNSFKYDIVIRSRFDLDVFDKFDFVDWDLVRNNFINIPIGWDHRGGLNDLFAYGTSEAMDYYSSLFLFLNKYIQSGTLIHPETLLRRHLLDYRGFIMRSNIPISLRGKRCDSTYYMYQDKK